MRRRLLLALSSLLLLTGAPPLAAADRVPGEHWLRFVDPADAGFDADRLAAARKSWEALPSSAFLIVADGAVVAAWGDVERRFMCHSVRKSFLSGLYGIYWDRGELELDRTLADLGIDDQPEPLLESEKRARILDLLKARSGVFHPAAYAGRTDSRPRGSEGPGRYFAYNNWDFNTLAAILEQETGARVFEAFDESFAQPLLMEDWRLSDGYYHYELDKSKYPAYPFRMSARDAARFGLLFAREGLWGQTRVLSRDWVRRSTALYSIDDERMGYGYMWWVFREPRFARHGMFAALGVGNQMIAALPDSDLVIVNRADTYEGERTPMDGLLDLIEAVLEARTGSLAPDPRLVSLEAEPADPGITEADAEKLEAFSGHWSFPAPPLGLPEAGTLEITLEEGHLKAFSPQAGTFALYLEPDGSLHEEDSRERYLPVRDDAGAFAGLADADSILHAALLAAADSDRPRSEALLALLDGENTPIVEAGKAAVELLAGSPEDGWRALQALVAVSSADEVESTVNRLGYRLLGSERTQAAYSVMELNTRLFPEASNTWDSLAEVEEALGRDDQALAHYRRSLKLDPDNRNAEGRIEQLQAGEAPPLDIEAAMASARIPGLTYAIVRNGEVIETRYLGVADAATGAPVTEETLFEAASLSKPVFAAIVLRLAERGELDLDHPLLEYLPNERVDHDPRSSYLTARVVLSHRTGLPNWGPKELELSFFPGTRFGYSGEGYVYLQKVVEHLTGLDLDELAQREIFGPLGMRHSRYSWSEDERLPLATPHDATGRPLPKQSWTEANAAGSLHTTAADYARFLLAWGRSEILSDELLRQAVSPAVGMRGDERPTYHGWEIRGRIAWGLGWGLQLPEEGESGEPIAWHWGDNGPFKAFVAFRPGEGSGMVYFANAENGLAVGRGLIAEHFDDLRPAFAWTGTEPYDAPGFEERIVAMEAEGEGRYEEAIASWEAVLAAEPGEKATVRRIDWLRELGAATESPVQIPEGLLRAYAGSYGPRTLVLRDGRLTYRREGRPEFTLVPLSRSLFALEGLPGFRLEVVTDAAGEPVRLVGHYVEGGQDETPRDAPTSD